MEQAYAGRIHVLLTDLVLPGISGNELAERLQVRRPEMRVLYTSGYREHPQVRQLAGKAF